MCGARGSNIQRRIRLFGFCLFVPYMFVANAQENVHQSAMEKITTNWQCKWCPYEDGGSEGEVKAGVGAVSNDSFKFGDYTGLNEEGAYFIGDAEYYYQGEKGQYADVEAYNLGLKSRQMDVQGGWQGLFDLGLRFDQIPKLNSDTTRTPYRGDGDQRLPSDWVGGSTTKGMTELDNAMRDVDILTERRTIELGATYHQTTALSYDFVFRRDTKEGYNTSGLGIGSNFASARAAILATPVDYVTDQGEIKINYTKSRWQTSFSYQFSKFKNEINGIKWQNAFFTDPGDPSPSNVPAGQAGLTPDNTMQKFTLSGAYKFHKSTVASALFSAGRLEQNDTFLPYTTNPDVSSPALPRTSLDGKINTFDAVLAVNSKFAKDFQLDAKYTQNEQDNQTPRAAYEYVIADTAVAGSNRAPRSNLPYSFRMRQALLEGRYRYNKHHNFALGYQYDTADRTFQEVDKTTENTRWGTYRGDLINKLDFFVRLENSNRSGSDYHAMEDIKPAEDPLMRKYNLANRDRNKAGLNLSYTPIQRMILGFYADYAKDDYKDSELGLQDGEHTNYTLDFQYGITEAISFNIDYTVTNINSNQKGRPSTSAAIWDAENDERIDVSNLGFLYKIIRDKLDLGFNFTYADSSGDIKVSTGEPFPSVTSTRQTFKIYSDYAFTDRATLNVFFLYEIYDEENWSIDGLAPNTIDNVLTMGEVSPSYEVGFLAVSLKYAF